MLFRHFCLTLFCMSLKVLPYINPFAFDGDANSGDSVQLMCHVAKGDLPIKVKWLFRNTTVNSAMGAVSTKIGDRTSVLSLSSVSAGNSGDYTCVASNSAGQFNHSAELNVNGIQLYRLISQISDFFQFYLILLFALL